MCGVYSTRCILAVGLASSLLLAGCAAAGDPITPSPTAPQATSESPMPTYAPDSVVGDLAPGFPPELAPLPPDTTIVASAATPGPQTTRISLTLDSATPAADLATYYGNLLAGLGFAAVPAAAPNGPVAITGYTRSTGQPAVKETLTVAILDGDSSRSVSISGDLVPAPH